MWCRRVTVGVVSIPPADVVRLPFRILPGNRSLAWSWVENVDHDVSDGMEDEEARVVWERVLDGWETPVSTNMIGPGAGDPTRRCGGVGRG